MHSSVFLLLSSHCFSQCASFIKFQHFSAEIESLCSFRKGYITKRWNLVLTNSVWFSPLMKSPWYCLQPKDSFINIADCSYSEDNKFPCIYWNRSMSFFAHLKVANMCSRLFSFKGVRITWNFKPSESENCKSYDGFLFLGR